MKKPILKRLFHLDRFGRRLERSLDEEVNFHLETRIEELKRKGRSPEEARAEALRTFGDPELVVQRCRRIDQRGARRRAFFELFSDALHDVRFAFRSLRKARGFSLIVVLSLAVGIGVNAALFTAIHAVWLAPVPGVTEQDRIVDMVTIDGGSEWWGWSFPDFAAVRAANTPLESITAWNEGDATLGAEEETERVKAAFATSSYFQVLGAPPTLGRSFLASEDVGPGQHPVAVISHDLWQNRMDGRPDVLGQAITVNRLPYTVIGVAPEGFRGARVTLSSIDLWLPLVQHTGVGGENTLLEDRERFTVQVLGRLRPAATLPEVQAAVQTVFGRLAAEFPETNENRTVRAAAFGRFPAQNRIWDMIAVAGLWGLLVVFLLIICGNLAGMTLARSASREQEVAVRLALGSSRIRLVRHLMVEAFLLALTGWGLGVVMALIAMAKISPVDLGIVAPGVSFQPSGWVLAMSLVMAFAAALAFGLLPALRFSRPELVSSLKDDSGGGGWRVGRIQRFAASAQTGVALLLLVFGTLFFRSLTQLGEGELGFRPDGMAVTDFGIQGFSSALLDLTLEGYPNLEEGGSAFIDGMARALGSLPAVTSVAMADGFPLDRRGAFGRAGPSGQLDETESRVAAEFTRVTEGYFPAIGAPILQGRGFLPTDDANSEPVAIITQSMADRLWPGEDALGRHLLWPAGSEDATARRVVGVVGHVASSRPSDSWPHVFLPLRQSFTPRLLIVVRTEAEISTLAEALTRALRSVDPGLPIPSFIPGRDLVARATEGQRANGQIGGGLGLLALLLSAFGVYGVVALAVTNRTREIGVRMAMGATRREIVRTVLGDAIRLAAPGLVIGALLAAGLAAAMRSMLLGLSPVDPISFLSAGGLLLLVVLLAGLAPARKASGIHPVEALRAVI